jgi:hypothetical protein
MDRGLDRDGFIRPEVAVSRISPPYAPVVADLRRWCAAAFGADLHSLYLNGSVVKGTARPGISDLDALAVLRVPLTTEHEARAREVEAVVQRRFPFLSGVGLGLIDRDLVLSPAQRYDMGFFLKCLCACVDGEDLGEQLPRYRPSVALARGTNGNIRRLLDNRRQRLAATTDQAFVAELCRGFMRKIVRTAFTLVMPRYHGWTSELEPAAEVFAGFYPEHANAIRQAVALARAPSGDWRLVLGVLDTFGAWLADEYDRVIMRPGGKSTSLR